MRLTADMRLPQVWQFWLEGIRKGDRTSLAAIISGRSMISQQVEGASEPAVGSAIHMEKSMPLYASFRPLRCCFGAPDARW
jgi:hypothetical protein